MYSEHFPSPIRNVRLQISVNDGRVGIRAHINNVAIAYDSGFEVGMSEGPGHAYITTGGAHFVVTKSTLRNIVVWLKRNGVKVTDFSAPPTIFGKKATHVIVDEIYPATTSASEAVAAAADSTDD